MVILVASKAAVTIGPGAVVEQEMKKSAEDRDCQTVNGDCIPDGGVVGLGLGGGRNIPGELHSGRESARLAAALPDVVGAARGRSRLDADVVRGRAVANVAAVRVVRAVLRARKL